MIVAIHGLGEYLNLPYRGLLDVLSEMPTIVGKLGLTVEELPDFTTVCTRKQDLDKRVWRRSLQRSAELFETGEIQAIDSTSLAYRVASRTYAKRVGDMHESVKTTAFIDCDTVLYSTSTAR